MGISTDTGIDISIGKGISISRGIGISICISITIGIGIGIGKGIGTSLCCLCLCPGKTYLNERRQASRQVAGEAGWRQGGKETTKANNAEGKTTSTSRNAHLRTKTKVSCHRYQLAPVKYMIIYSIIGSRHQTLKIENDSISVDQSVIKTVINRVNFGFYRIIIIIKI